MEGSPHIVIDTQVNLHENVALNTLRQQDKELWQHDWHLFSEYEGNVSQESMMFPISLYNSNLSDPSFNHSLNLPSNMINTTTHVVSNVLDTTQPNQNIPQQNINNARCSLLFTNTSSPDYHQRDITRISVATNTENNNAGSLSKKDSTINNRTSIILGCFDQDNDTYNLLEEISEMQSLKSLDSMKNSTTHTHSPPKLQTKNTFLRKKQLISSDNESQGLHSNQNDSQMREVEHTVNVFTEPTEVNRVSKHKNTSYLLDRGEGDTLLKTSQRDNTYEHNQENDTRLNTCDTEKTSLVLEDLNLHMASKQTRTKAYPRVNKKRFLRKTRTSQPKLPLNQNDDSFSVDEHSKNVKTYTLGSNQGIRESGSSIKPEEQGIDSVNEEKLSLSCCRPDFRRKMILSTRPRPTFSEYISEHSCSNREASAQRNNESTSLQIKPSFDISSGANGEYSKDTFNSKYQFKSSYLDLRKSPKMNSKIQIDIASSIYKVNRNVPKTHNKDASIQCKQHIPSQCHKTTSFEQCVEGKEWDKMFIPVLRNPHISTTKNNHRRHSKISSLGNTSASRLQCLMNRAQEEIRIHKDMHTPVDRTKRNHANFKSKISQRKNNPRFLQSSSSSDDETTVMYAGDSSKKPILDTIPLPLKKSYNASFSSVENSSSGSNNDIITLNRKHNLKPRSSFPKQHRHRNEKENSKDKLKKELSYLEMAYKQSHSENKLQSQYLVFPGSTFSNREIPNDSLSNQDSPKSISIHSSASTSLSTRNRRLQLRKRKEVRFESKELTSGFKKKELSSDHSSYDCSSHSISISNSKKENPKREIPTIPTSLFSSVQLPVMSTVYLRMMPFFPGCEMSTFPLRVIIESCAFVVIGMIGLLFIFKLLATFTGGVYISPLFTLKPMDP